MIERALLTAGIVVVIIGALGKVSEQTDKVFSRVNCTLSGNTNCPDPNDSSTNDDEDSQQGKGQNTRSRRNSERDTPNSSLMAS